MLREARPQAVMLYQIVAGRERAAYQFLSEMCSSISMTTAWPATTALAAGVNSVGASASWPCLASVPLTGHACSSVG